MELKVLITGSAGFISFHLTNRLLDSGFNVDRGIEKAIDWYKRNL